jgi:hypothetical protein
MRPENIKFGHASFTCFASSTHLEGSMPDFAESKEKCFIREFIIAKKSFYNMILMKEKTI